MNYKRYSGKWITRAAQLIFLNKTCYNGLFRVNQKGAFNVPFGKYKNPKIYQENNIKKVSELLKIAEIRLGNFEDSLQNIDDKSFVYFDPPYRPISETSAFTAYSKQNFTDTDQIRLGIFFANLDKKCGAKLMLSNSDPHNIDPNDNFFYELYKDFNIHKVFASRMVNCNGNKRGRISELVITNY